MTHNTNNIHKKEISFEMPVMPTVKELAGGVFLFRAYDCALMEHRNEVGTYIYTAVNLKNGKTDILSRRKHPLDDSEFGNMAARIHVSPIRGDGKFAIERKPGESAAILSLIETAGYIFSEILPMHGYHLRENQVELAKHIRNYSVAIKKREKEPIKRT